MPRLQHVERKIAKVEGFDVVVRYSDGQDMRGDKEMSQSYGYRAAARQDWTVAQWREQRFQQTYAGYDVAVLLGDGKTEAAGNMKLSTVRESYEQ
jgi:hypothetical protein